MNTEHIPDDWRIEHDGRRVYIYDATGRQRCGARRKSDNKPCLSQPMENGRCRMHNGNAATGIEHGQFKHGRDTRYRKAMPERLQSIYDAQNDDSDLNNLDPNIILIDTRMAELLSRLATGDYGATYPKMRDLYQSADIALSARDMQRFAVLWIEMQKLIDSGNRDYAVWQEIIKLNELRGKMVERKMNILTKAQMAITTDEFFVILKTLEHAFDRAIELSTVDERRIAVAQAIEKVLLLE